MINIWAKSKAQLVLFTLTFTFTFAFLCALSARQAAIPLSLARSLAVPVAHKMAGLGAAIIQFIRQHFSAKFMRSVYNVP